MVTSLQLLVESVGPFTRRDLCAIGITRSQLDLLVRRAVVVHAVRGVYVPTPLLGDPAVRVRAAGLGLPPGAVVCRRTAAWVHGEDARGPGERGAPLPMECVVPAGSVVPRRTGLVTYEARLDDADVCEVAGIPVTSVARTAVDVVRWSTPHVGLAGLDSLAHRGLVDLHDLVLRVEDLAGQRFAARARRAIALCEPATESYGESWLRLRIVDAGFPRPKPQVWLVDARGRGVYRLDLGWSELRLAVEYDGVEFHADPAARRADASRRAQCADRWGWTVVGVGRAEVLGSSLALERGLGELLSLAPTLRQRAW